jgi:hypothetical protein
MALKKSDFQTGVTTAVIAAIILVIVKLILRKAGKGSLADEF